MGEQQIKELLEKLKTWANQDSHAVIKLTGWERIIRWKVAGVEVYWQTGDGRIEAALPQPAQLSLECSPETLAQIVSGKLQLFLAIWGSGELNLEGSFADAFQLGYVFLKDHRKRQVVFLAHCFLNVNTRFPGGAGYQGATLPLIDLLTKSGCGIVQMPCPEMLVFGLEKEKYGLILEAEVRQAFRDIAAQVLNQAEAYLKQGYNLLGIIGMNPSPSCGVEVTKGKGTLLGRERDTSEQPGSGVFIEELRLLARERGLGQIPLLGVRRSLPGEEQQSLADLANKLRIT